MYGIIYKITNKLNGKVYVGQTTRPLTERFREHAKCKKTIIGKAIRKNGKKNFAIEVLEECASQEQLNECEIFWIAHFDCKAPNGYNLTGGGEGSGSPSPETRAKLSAATRGEKNPHFGKRHTAEVRERIAASKRGKKLSAETRAKMSASRRGAKHHQYGKPLTPEWKRKLSESNRGRTLSAEARAKISRALRGKKLSEEVKARMSAGTKSKHAVICVESRVIYESIRMAARWLKVSDVAIYRACRDLQMKVLGLHFQFVENFDESQP